MNEALEMFRQKLSGWMTIESEDYCPDCWKKYLERFSDRLDFNNMDASPTATRDIALSRKWADGFLVYCGDVFEYDRETFGCGTEVLVRFNVVPSTPH